MRKLLPAFAIIFPIMLLIVSCKKGDTGAAGAPGSTGATGATGPQGPAGLPGRANVIYSNWLNVTFAPASADSSVWSANIQVPQLVDSILNKGEIKVYWNAGSDSANSQFILPLPVTDLFLFGGLVSISPYYSQKSILLASNFDLSSFKDNAGFNNSQFRYILIPGNVNGRVRETINWNNYAEVKAYLGLKD